MQYPDGELRQRFIDLVQQIAQDMRSRPLEPWPDFDLTLPQMRVLLILHQEPQRVSVLAALLGIAGPSATAMIDRLVSKGLVERVNDAEDRRAVICRLTDAGMQEVDLFTRLRQFRSGDMVGFLTREELVTVVNAMELLANAIRRGEQYSAAPSSSRVPD